MRKKVLRRKYYLTKSDDIVVFLEGVERGWRMVVDNHPNTKEQTYHAVEFANWYRSEMDGGWARLITAEVAEAKLGRALMREVRSRNAETWPGPSSWLVPEPAKTEVQPQPQPKPQPS